MKQTAVEWFFNALIENQDKTHKQIESIFQQAKEMEKQQIIEAYNTSFLLRDKPYSTAEKYYNETFNKSIKNKG